MQHIPGPKTLFLNPVIYDDIEVCDAVKLTAGEAAVVYTQHVQGLPASPSEQKTFLDPSEASSTAKARVVHGPVIFVPTATEWLHEFPWLASPSGGSE